VSGHVSSIPAQGTPQLAKMGSTEQVRQLAECDGLMYAVGAFTAIEWGGAIPAPGLGGFTPDGSLLTNGNRTQGRYSRARGLGADDMLRTSAGLWIASDNFDGSVTCGGVPGHAGICFLPNA
jgi:hypothetical protein